MLFFRKFCWLALKLVGSLVDESVYYFLSQEFDLHRVQADAIRCRDTDNITTLVEL